MILEVIGFMYRGLNYGTIGSGLWSASTARGDDPRGLHRLRATALADVNPTVWASAYFGFKIGAGNASCLQV